MISGNMYWLEEPKLSLPEHVRLLMELYKPKNIKYILVPHHVLSEEIVVDNIKIKPNKLVIKNHFWVIYENSLETCPNIPNWEK